MCFARTYNQRCASGLGLAAILLYCSAVFYLNSHRRKSLAFWVLAVSLAFWAVLMGVGQLQNPWTEMFGNASRLFGPVPQMLLGIAMVMVLFENQRNAVQENTLALSTLGVDPRRLLFAEDLVPSMQAALERLRSALPMERAAIFITERWRGLLPSVQQGFAPGFLEALEKQRRWRLHLRTRVPAKRNLYRAAPGGDDRTASRWRRWEHSRNSREFSPKRKSAI